MPKPLFFVFVSVDCTCGDHDDHDFNGSNVKKLMCYLSDFELGDRNMLLVSFTVAIVLRIYNLIFNVFFFIIESKKHSFYALFNVLIEDSSLVHI